MKKKRLIFFSFKEKYEVICLGWSAKCYSAQTAQVLVNLKGPIGCKQQNLSRSFALVM